uniref:Uncharacterized protein n=1 Tax=Pararge aegeria TaxID=116150 RepID=S4PYK5_9NEOP
MTNLLHRCDKNPKSLLLYYNIDIQDCPLCISRFNLGDKIYFYLTIPTLVKFKVILIKVFVIYAYSSVILK